MINWNEVFSNTHTSELEWKRFVSGEVSLTHFDGTCTYGDSPLPKTLAKRVGGSQRLRELAKRALRRRGIGV